ncbi:type II toxin-antitoxin system VapC family toxin [Panacagrimonas sp.]|uniref:type II toxin-antitoxin system VapC family toxin n=1 Tax=Panacagrimonas sp. TaxID=2480088 RepID=UPI003B51EEE2
MKVALDSSVLTGALLEREPHNQSCRKLLTRRSLTAWTHAISETFSSLTGGRQEWRVPPSVASQLIDGLLMPRLNFIELNAQEMSAALREAQAAGVRGGAVHDYLHLVAARKAGVGAFYTLNLRHFVAVARRGDPEILPPESLNP